MKKAVILQVVIFIIAWSIMIPDVLEDNTYIFGLIGSYDLVRGNTHWVLLGAAILSVLNIIVWWPKEVKKNVTSSEAPIAAEAKVDQDPKTPVID